MKISVVVPNYNHSASISQTIDGILSQTYRDFELIIVDDGSTDDSVEILKRYQQKNSQNSAAVVLAKSGHERRRNGRSARSKRKLILRRGGGRLSRRSDVFRHRRGFHAPPAEGGWRFRPLAGHRRGRRSFSMVDGGGAESRLLGWADISRRFSEPQNLRSRFVGDVSARTDQRGRRPPGRPRTAIGLFHQPRFAGSAWSFLHRPRRGGLPRVADHI